MDRDNRHTVTCIDDALAREDLSEHDRMILMALRQFIVEQWVPHLEMASEKVGEIDDMKRKVSEMYDTMFQPLDELDDVTLAQLLKKTAVRANVWWDGACFVVKFVLPVIAVTSAAVLWLIRNHELIR